MKALVWRRKFGIAGLVLLTLALSGCDEPDPEYQSKLAGGESVHARADRLNGSIYSTSVTVLSSHAAKFVVQIVDADIVYAASTLKDGTVEAGPGHQVNVEFISHLNLSTNLVISSVLPGEGASTEILHVAFGPGRVEYWLHKADLGWVGTVLWGFTFLSLLLAVTFRRRFLARRENRTRVPAKGLAILDAPPQAPLLGPGPIEQNSQRKLEVHVLALERKFKEALESTRQHVEAPGSELDSMRRIEEELDSRLREVLRRTNELCDEVDKLKQLPVRDARLLDAWAREGILRTGSYGSDRDRWRAGVQICQLANDLLASGNPRIDLKKAASDRFSEFPGISLDWVSVQEDPGSPKRLEVRGNAKPGTWLACEIPADGSKLIVPAPHRFTVADNALLRLLFEGGDTTTSDDRMTLRVFRPAVLKGAPGKRTLAAKGRILTGNSQLSLSEHIIMLLERALLAGPTVGAVTAPAVIPVEAASGPPAEAGPAPPAKAEAEDDEAQALLGEMPARWWQPEMDKAALEGGAGAEDYLVRVLLVKEQLGIAASGLGHGWKAKLAWLRFDFEKDCLVLAELAETDGGVIPLDSGGRPSAPLRGRDLYQVAVSVVESAGKRALVFIPLGEFLLDNHVTVLSRLIDNPPIVPSIVKRILRPAIIERIRGKNYRILPKGQMQVEVKVEE